MVRRVDDAMFLWDSGRLEGAFLSALVAVAATSRRTFPDRKAISDKRAFETFLGRRRLFQKIQGVEYRGELHSIQHVFYKWLRCELVHEGGVPIDIEFTPDDGQGGVSVRAGGAPEYILKLSRNWFVELLEAVRTAPADSGLF